MVFFNPPPATLGAYRIAGTGASNPPPSSSSSISGMSMSFAVVSHETDHSLISSYQARSPLFQQQQQVSEILELTFLVLQGHVTNDANPAASPTADPPAGSYPAPGACPGVSNTNVTTSRGQSYRVQCYGETSGGSVPNQASGRSETGYTGCMIGCDANPQCIGFSWQSQTENVATDGSGGGTCYYKGGTVSFITPGNQRNVAVYKIASPPVVSTSSASTGVSSTSQSSSTLQQSSSQSLSGSSTTSQLSSSTAPSSSTSQSSATSPTSSSSTSTLQQSSSTAQSSSSSTSQPPSSSTAQSSSTTSQPPSSSSALSSTISQLSLSTTQSTSTLQQSSSTTQSSSTSQPSSSTGLSSSTSQQFTSSSQSSSTLSQSSSTVLSSSTSQLSTSQTLSSSTTTLSSSATPSSSTSSLSSSQALSSSTTTSQLSSSTAQTSTGSSTSSGLPSSSTSSVLTGLSSSSSISSSLGSTTVPATATTASFTSSTLTASQASTTSSSSSSSGTSTTSSATSSTSIIVGSPTACPGVNGTVVADPAGILYNIMCQSDIWGSDLQPFDTTTVGYQDCFATCDSNALCSGFTWLSSAGSTTGAGAGTCYQKQLLNGVNYFYRPNGVNSYPNNVAAIKRTYGQTGVAPSFTSTIAV
ncbi:Putative PAN/Apple domain-containing protein [Septoria linicola]|uniref:PAN/Apple domain-containing protein n=1 Tax=Septoria linicola TaxID=215465 RepID=A0A9Q9EFA3_9PEZI|nr:putative PAN/Apple domain-containing protein [Septoria linicola]USW46998.1 Putative PAN/Apple domain-containing protein [Septoria linicola]